MLINQYSMQLNTNKKLQDGYTVSSKWVYTHSHSYKHTHTHMHSSYSNKTNNSATSFKGQLENIYHNQSLTSLSPVKIKA